MGICQSRYHHKLAINQSKYYVGPNIFINLEADDMLKQYEIINVIGSGHYGEVRLVKHKLTQTERAMKQIKKSNEQAKDKMFFQEVETYLLMDHPNIMRIYETYQDNKNYFIISEYLKGGDLLARIIKNKQNGNIDEKEISYYMQQVLSGISYCHACGIIHRDIKPANIIFESQDANSVLKIIDFGASKIKMEKEAEDDQEIVGTPLYIAPEVVDPYKKYDEKCDVWSTGMMLYQLLTGEFPFNEKQSPEAIIDTIAHYRLNFAALNQNQTISDDAKDLIKKMLQKDPTKRISTTQALNHRWIKNPNKLMVSSKTLENIKNFHVSNRLQMAVLYMISTQMSSSKENEKWRKQFQAIDQNHDGKLEETELKKVYQVLYGDPLKANSIAENVMKKADLDNNHKIDFSEFLVASQQISQSQSKKKLEKVFKLLDQNNDGYITVSELQKVIVGAQNEQFQEFIKENDRDRDGRIDYSEFIEGFHKKIEQDQFRNSLRQTISYH